MTFTFVLSNLQLWADRVLTASDASMVRTRRNTGRGGSDDPWDAWGGCSCIAGAMVHGYWGNNDYSSLAIGEDALIDENHHYMGTDDEGSTWPWNIDDGIAAVFDAYGYNDTFSVYNTSGTNWGLGEFGIFVVPGLVAILEGTWLKLKKYRVKNLPNNHLVLTCSIVSC